MPSWDEVEELLIGLADEELREGFDSVTPCLVAFAGARLRFLAFLRPFPQGAYHQPLIEVLALAARLGSDRVAFAASGRAWSLDDPIPPVTDDGDLRQTVLMLELVDRIGGAAARSSAVVPFTQGPDGEPRWAEPQRLGESEGWIADVLELAVGSEMRARRPPSDAAIAAHARRVVRLGHDLYLAADLEERLTRLLAGAPCSRPRRAMRRRPR